MLKSARLKALHPGMKFLHLVLFKTSPFFESKWHLRDVSCNDKWILPIPEAFSVPHLRNHRNLCDIVNIIEIAIQPISSLFSTFVHIVSYGRTPSQSTIKNMFLYLHNFVAAERIRMTWINTWAIVTLDRNRWL